MGPCSCADGSLHTHPHFAVEHKLNHHGHDPKREERIRKARRQMLFGDGKVDSNVALAATDRLRESEQAIQGHEHESVTKPEHGHKVFELAVEDEEENKEEGEGKGVAVAETGEETQGDGGSESESDEVGESEEFWDGDEEEEDENEDEQEIIASLWVDSSRMC